MQLKRKTRFWKYLLPAVAAIMVVGFAVAPRPTPPTVYLRYTSPPFPDEVRYTFLYPSTLDDTFIYSFSVSSHEKYLQSLDFTEKESRLPGAALWHRWFKPEAEFVTVIVEKLTIKPLRSIRLAKQKWDGVEISHTVEVDDPRAHEHFRFSHAQDFGRTAAFHQHDQVVTDSFRILLPGEPIPAP